MIATALEALAEAVSGPVAVGVALGLWWLILHAADSGRTKQGREQ